jgi:hypothetical protein
MDLLLSTEVPQTISRSCVEATAHVSDSALIFDVQNWTFLGQDWRLWGLLLLSVGSLLWNEMNRRKTNETAKKIRSENVKLDEFRSSIKDPLNASLEACQSIALRADAIAVNAKPLDEMVDEINAIQSEILPAIADLETRLFDADESEFSGAGDWTHGFEDYQDTVYQSFELASDDTVGETERKEALRQFKSATLEFRKSKRKKMSDEIKQITGI